MLRQLQLLIYLDTSKHGSPGLIHGRNGTFLPSLAAQSILTITSHHHAHRSHATLILHHSRPAARLVPAPVHHQLSDREHGTKITVQNLFGNMPVRVKQRGLNFEGAGKDEKQMDLLQKYVVGLLLAWDVPITLTLRGAGSSKKLFVRGKGSNSKETRGPSSSRSYDLSLARSILSQATYIDPSDWEYWVKTSARTPFITIQGAISLQPAPSKNVQFIALGVHYLDSNSDGNVLYDEVNRLFASSNFGKQEDVPDAEEQERRSKDRRFKQGGYTNKQLKRGGKGVDRWPKFSLRINCHDISSLHQSDVYTALERESTISSLLKVLGALINGFLSDHHFRPRAVRTRNRPKLLGESANSQSLHALRPSPSQIPLRTHKGTAPADYSVESIPLTVLEHAAPADVSLVANLQKEKKCAARISSVYMGDDSGGSVRLPSFSRSRDLHFDHTFSGWTRMKSGKPGSPHDELFRSKPESRARLQRLRSASSTSTPTQTFDDKDGESSAEPWKELQPTKNCSGEIFVSGFDVPALDDPFVEDDSPKDNIAIPQMEKCDITPEIEQTVSWINPISKARVLVNARTGLVVNEQSKRPSSASADNTSKSRATQYSNQATMLKSDKRLPCNGSAALSTPKTGSWVGNFLKKWDNPVFKPTEESIPQVSFDGPTAQSDDILHGKHQHYHADIRTAFTEASSVFSTRLSKESLTKAQVIAQVDQKFILVRMGTPPAAKDLEQSNSTAKQLLVLVDQHAADERIRNEGLLADLCQAPTSETRTIRSSLNLGSAIETTLLEKPITFQVQAREHCLFTTHAGHFAHWGILFDLSALLSGPKAIEVPTCKLTVRTLPAVIAERCRIEPKILIELLRGELWKREELGLKFKAPPSPTLSRPSSTPSSTNPVWLSRISSCPSSILDMLNSRSCRSAIMFNDILTIDECNNLIARLAKCVFPFQCAHGRPSMVPLAELGSGEGLGIIISRPSKDKVDSGFGEQWRKWNAEIKKMRVDGNVG